jgi:hypothetical protein
MSMTSLAVGIADRKNAELNQLTALVTEAQYLVEQQQAIVDALQAKSAQYAEFLGKANDNQATALAHLNLAKDAVASAQGLYDSLGVAIRKVEVAAGDIAKPDEGGISNVAAQMAVLIGKLIFSVEFINKVAQLANKQKASNPLLPDSLIATLVKAGGSANNAIALTLVALQSCYAAEATLLESKAMIISGGRQSAAMVKSMRVGWDDHRGTLATPLPDVAGGLGILALLQIVYSAAVDAYQLALWNNNSVSRQLTQAQAALATDTVQLNSYKSGLAAATAAAYAA